MAKVFSNAALVLQCCSQRFAATSQSPTDADVVQADGETSLSQPGAEVEQSQPRMQTDDWEMLGHTLQTGIYTE